MVYLYHETGSYISKTTGLHQAINDLCTLDQQVMAVKQGGISKKEPKNQWTVIENSGMAGRKPNLKSRRRPRSRKGSRCKRSTTSDSDSEDVGRAAYKRVSSGRKRIDIKYISEKQKRHVTFSKRRGGLEKKAYELNQLTGADVLMLVVSQTGLCYHAAFGKFGLIESTRGYRSYLEKLVNDPDAAESQAQNAHDTLKESSESKGPWREYFSSTDPGTQPPASQHPITAGREVASDPAPLPLSHLPADPTTAAATEWPGAASLLQAELVPIVTSDFGTAPAGTSSSAAPRAQARTSATQELEEWAPFTTGQTESSTVAPVWNQATTVTYSQWENVISQCSVPELQGSSDITNSDPFTLDNTVIESNYEQLYMAVAAEQGTGIAVEDQVYNLVDAYNKE